MAIPDPVAGQSPPREPGEPLASEHDHVFVEQRVVDLAVAGIRSCQWASLTQLKDGELQTSATTGPGFDEADAAQYRLEEGPSLDAIWADDTYHVRDASTETRRPRWCRVAHALGVGSMLTVRLATSTRKVGALNLYASESKAFDDKDIQEAHRLAATAAVALARSREFSTLHRSLQTRHIVEIALEILMDADQRLTPGDAFRALCRAAEDDNIGLRRGAEVVIERHDAALPTLREATVDITDAAPVSAGVSDPTNPDSSRRPH